MLPNLIKHLLACICTVVNVLCHEHSECMKEPATAGTEVEAAETGDSGEKRGQEEGRKGNEDSKADRDRQAELME